MVDGKKIQYFLFSQYLADGVRVTLEIILPVIIFSYLGDFHTGILLATGAFCVSISDIPGPVKDKRNGMLYSIGFIGIMSVLTGLVNHSPWALGLLLVSSSFFFTMIGVYGNRAAFVGAAALLIMIIRMREIETVHTTCLESAWIIAGGTWYMLVAILFNQLSPNRPAQRALGETLHETATYLNLKASMYESGTDHEDTYKQLLTQQVRVNEKQDITRELLFKNRAILRESTRTGRMLMFSFVNAVDLFDQVNATWYDYGKLKEKYSHTDLLPDIAAIIRRMAEAIDQAGLAIQSNRKEVTEYAWLPELDNLKARIDAMDDGSSSIILKKILVNLRQIGEMIQQINLYFKGIGPKRHDLGTEQDFSKFVTHQVINPLIFFNNLSINSAAFRHALRMSLTCLLAYLVALSLSYGEHSYWIILTVMIILKPGFSLTRQRNIERITGTVAGGIIAFGLLWFIRDETILYALVIFFMIGTYTFQRLNYIIMVVFITPYLLIVLHLMGFDFINLVTERMIDTAIGFGLAYAANHWLFPNWESNQFRQHMTYVLRANISYLEQIAKQLTGVAINPVAYRLARKDLYVHMANLSAAFHRMITEPKSKQQAPKESYQFVVLNQLLSANVASLAAEQMQPGKPQVQDAHIPMIRRIYRLLADTLSKLDPLSGIPVIQFPESAKKPQQVSDKHLSDQLEFIHKLALDIRKTGEAIMQENQTTNA